MSARHRFGNTFEEGLETLVRKIYPLANRHRNPMVQHLDGHRRVLHHGGSKDHYFAIYQCFYKRQYEVPVPLFTPGHHAIALQALYARITGAGGTPLIVDCGANIGASAAWFSARYDQARIIAIEPESANVGLLRRNVEPLGITVLHAAIGSHDGSAFLDGHTTSSLSNRVMSDGAGEAVRVLSLRTVLDQAVDAQPFILKIDIEGGEKVLFGEAHDLLSRFPLIVIEPHDFCMPGEDVSRAFFAFHAASGRDFLFGQENIFSVDYKALLMADTNPRA